VTLTHLLPKHSQDKDDDAIQDLDGHMVRLLAYRSAAKQFHSTHELSMDRLLAAIVDDDRGTVKQLLAADGLIACGWSTVELVPTCEPRLDIFPYRDI